MVVLESQFRPKDIDSEPDMKKKRKKRGYISIKVSITKSREFRARIKESKSMAPYEVTIGGRQWNGGKGRQFEDIIKKKIQYLMEVLNKTLERINTNIR